MEELVEQIKKYLQEADYQLNTCGDVLVASFLFGKAEALADELYRNYSEDIATYFPDYYEKAAILDCDLFGE